MRFDALDKELDAICKDYDYGIVPGSVTVFVRDKVENTGKLELSILEGIMLVIEACDEGFMVASCIPFIDSPIMNSSLKLVQDHLDYKFGTMDKLLMTISPLFAQRYLERIKTNCVSPTLTDLPPVAENSLFSPSVLFDPLLSLQNASTTTASSLSSTSVQHQQISRQQASSTYSNDIFEWIH